MLTQDEINKLTNQLSNTNTPISKKLSSPKSVMQFMDAKCIHIKNERSLKISTRQFVSEYNSYAEIHDLPLLDVIAMSPLMKNLGYLRKTTYLEGFHGVAVYIGVKMAIRDASTERDEYVPPIVKKKNKKLQKWEDDMNDDSDPAPLNFFE
jgi:hypothetical protein